MGKWTLYGKLGKRRNGSIDPSILPSLNLSLLYQSTESELNYNTGQAELSLEMAWVFLAKGLERGADTATRQSSVLCWALFCIYAFSEYFSNHTTRICSLSLVLTSCLMLGMSVNLKKSIL